MATPNISLIVPLVDAQQNRKFGSKATNLSKLIAARFAVPRGFVVSADAYRSHLWASGARKIASTEVEAEEREELRTAILSSEIPEDIWQSITEAYERLSWQAGVTDPKVIVRPSSLEGDSLDSDFAGAYESYLNVSGLDALKLAIKRVWASLWGGKAAVYRMKYGGSTEPAMAVIVQQMVTVSHTGSAFTTDPVTGNPHKVLISCSPANDGVVSLETTQPSYYTVDLCKPFAVDRREQGHELIENSVIQYIAEKTVLIENVISGRVEVEWAFDGERVLFLQARPITALSAYFPIDCKDEANEQSGWTPVTTHPVSHFSRDHLWENPSKHGLLPLQDCAKKYKLINGYVCTLDVENLSHTIKPCKKDIQIAYRLLSEWKQKIEPGFSECSQRIIKSDLAASDYAGLQQMLAETAKIVSEAAQWLEYVHYPSTMFPSLLRKLLYEKSKEESLYRQLLSGLPMPAIMCDAKLQELGERFTIAEKTGKLSDEKWWRGFKQEVEAFACDYGYSFKDADEMCDIAGWMSWVEDTETVFRMIGAMAQQDKRSSLVTVHCAAEADAEEASQKAAELFKGKLRRDFMSILQLSRGWLIVENEAELAFARACAALRLILVEMGNRLKASKIVVDRNDVFQLTLDEILKLPTEPTDEARKSVARNIADRKHDIWLEQRLAPATDTNEALEARCEDLIIGAPISSGTATGRARIIDNIADVGELESGDIVVVKTSKLAWTPLFAVAGGFICEQGDEFCYGAIVAREYGIPAVMNCKGITSIIKDYQKVRVNGSEGIVELNVI